jgi:hypothetical protein
MPRNSPASPPARGKPSARHPNERSSKPAGRTVRAAAAKSAVRADREADTATDLQGPLNLAAMWTQFAEQVQRANEHTWQGLRHDIEAEAEDAQRADTPQRLAAVPISMAAEQAARWAQLSNELMTSLLDVQAAWFKQLEAVATQLLGPLFARDGRIAFASAQDIVETPAPNGPMQALQSAQQLWAESTKVWLQAMSHDLEDTSPSASARAT